MGKMFMDPNRGKVVSPRSRQGGKEALEPKPLEGGSVEKKQLEGRRLTQLQD